MSKVVVDFIAVDYSFCILEFHLDFPGIEKKDTELLSFKEEL